jgi:phenylacetate-CoA ligase
MFDFAKFCQNKKIVPYSPQGIISAAEVLHPFQRQTIEEVFRCKVFNTYGSREFMLIGAECDKHNGLHVSSENLYVEILDDQGEPCDAGEEGYIHVTDFHNYAMPFIRYKIGDMGIMSNEPCECGRAHPLLKKLTGRSLDILHLPGGKSLPGEFFPHFFKDYDAVQQFQINQDETGDVRISIVLNGDDKSVYLASIKSDLIEIVPELSAVTFQVEDSIALTSTGKHRVVVSLFEQ